MNWLCTFTSKPCNLLSNVVNKIRNLTYLKFLTKKDISIFFIRNTNFDGRFLKLDFFKELKINFKLAIRNYKVWSSKYLKDFKDQLCLFKRVLCLLISFVTRRQSCQQNFVLKWIILSQFFWRCVSSIGIKQLLFWLIWGNAPSTI
jgi:hypothetical protein